MIVDASNAFKDYDKQEKLIIDTRDQLVDKSIYYAAYYITGVASSLYERMNDTDKYSTSVCETIILCLYENNDKAATANLDAFKDQESELYNSTKALVNAYKEKDSKTIEELKGSLPKQVKISETIMKVLEKLGTEA